jgi:Na+-driven multidrug efflux pump
MDKVSAMLGAQGEMLRHCTVYGRIMSLALPFFVLQLEFQSFFITAETPKLGFFVTVASGLANMLLDALLVGLLPLEYKLIGAAVASGASQVVGGTVPLIYFARDNKSLLRFKRTSFFGRVVLQAVVNGSSEFMSNVSMSIVGILYNFRLMHYAGENGIAAYGVMMYVSMIFSAAFIGYSIGIAPVVGYNDGAGNKDELRGVFTRSLVIIGSLSLAMTIFSELLAVPLSALFVSGDASLMALTVRGFCIFSLAFLFMGYAIFSSCFFTALNDGVTSAIISFLRTLVFQAGAVMLLPLIMDIDGIWLSVAVAELMAVVISAIFLFFKRKRFS